MAATRKFLRGRDRFGLSTITGARRARQAVATLSALSFVLTPGSALASIIDASGTQIDTSKVTNIYAQTLLDANGFNRFNEFKLDAGKIANMYFQKADGTAVNGSLYNLVNSRIDINGTLNAIKNKTIGGSLYFLSKDGMVVGSSGVINAGSLTVATPTADYFKTMYAAVGDAASGSTGALATVMKDVSADWKKAIPINESGTISVLGRVNATDGIAMRAAKVAVGKNVSGETVYGTAADATVAGATVKTGVTDFSSLVNTSGTSANLSGDLKATQTGSGDIVLSAYNNYNENHTNSFYSVHFTNTANVDAELTVAGGASVQAAGKADLTAQAIHKTVTENYSAMLTYNESTGKYEYNIATQSAKAPLFGQNVATNATVNIDGTVTGNHVDIAAKATNKYSSAATSYAEDKIKEVLGDLGANVDVSWAYLDSDAEVNIGKTADISATGADTLDENGKVTEKALSIQATSTVDAGVGATAKNKSLLQQYTKHDFDPMPSSGVSITNTTNKATVNVDGKLASKGQTKIAATADSSVDTAAKVSSTSAVLNVAVNYTKGTNKSAVNIGKDARLTDGLEGNVTISSEATNSISSETAVSAKEKATIVTAVGITNYDSSAATTIAADIKSGGKLAISAENTVSDNDISVDNSIGSDDDDSIFNHLTENAQKQFNEAMKLDFQKKIEKELKDWGKQQHFGWEDVHNLFEAGASIGVVNESATSSVTVKPGLTLTAADALSIGASTVIEDTHMVVSGSAMNNDAADKDKKKQGTNNYAMVDVGVLYAGMDDSATVTIEGADAGKGATLTGSDVAVTAKTTFEYNRIDKLIENLNSTIEKLKKEVSFSDFKEFGAKVSELEACTAAFDKKRQAVAGTMTETDLWQTEEGLALTKVQLELVHMMAEQKLYNKLSNIYNKGQKVITAIKDFADYSNYVNFAAGTTTEGKEADEDAGDKEAKVGLAGSATITNLKNNSRVLIGKNTVIKATDGAVNLSAESSQKDIAMAGAPSLSGGATTAIGGTIDVGLMDANSLVVVAEGASITGNAINATATNDINHTNIAVAASSGTTNGVDVMVAYMDGDSNSIVSIDDEATLTATRSAGYASAKDEAKKDLSGAINIAATNDTSLIAIGGALGIGTGAGVGAGASITNVDRYTYAAIADNDYSGAALADDSETDKDKKLKQATAKKLNRLQYTIEKNLGTSDVNAKKSLLGSADTKATGSINATDVAVDAETSGQIVNVAVAGGVSTGDDDPTPNLYDKYKAWDENTTNKIKNYFDKFDNMLCRKIASVSGDKLEVHDVLKTDNQPSPTTTEEQSGLSIAGAGSVAVNILNGDTAALINNANINITTASTDDISKTNGVAVKAADDALAVAASGAAAISWKNRSKDDNSTGKSAAIAGEVGLNLIDSTVLASIADSKITNAAAITNSAEKTGATIAAGLSLALSREKSSQTTNAAAAGSVSVNIVDSDVYAVMQDNTVDETGAAKTAITNAAYDNDIEITGGLNASISTGGAKANAVGATVSYASLTNDVQSAIIGGTYKGIGTTDVTATTNETVVGVAAGIGVAAGSSTSSLALEGSAAYNKVDNYANAKVEGATMSGESLNVAAYDTAEKANAHASYIAERGFDADGSSYTEAVTGAANSIRGDKDTDGTAITKINTTRGGNTIVTGALSISGASGSGTSGAAAQGAVSVSDIDNDYNAAIQDSTITMSGDTVGTSVNAASNSILVGFGVGAGGSNGKASLGGSVSYEMTDNDVTATIENSKIYTPKTSVTATSGALEVNVAGQLNVSTGGSGAGAAFAYNALNNTTGAYVYGSTLTGIGSDATTISVDAANAGQVYSVGASLALSTSTASTGSALGGVAVVNTGKSDVDAIVDEYEDANKNKTRSSIKNAKSVSVKSSDSSSRLAVIGNVTASADRVSLGGSVAINDIGTLTKGKQSNKAAINNADITTTADGKVAVTAVDEASLTTVSVGTAVSTGGRVAGTGAGAATLLEKETAAELTSTNINNGAAASGTVTLDANTTNNIKTVGVVLAGNTGEAAAGLGVAVNKLYADTTVKADSVKASVKDLTGKSAAKNTITAIGIGGAAAKEAGVAGNIAVNLIGSDTKASLSGSTISSAGNIGLLADTTDTINNYGGALGIAAMGTGGAGVGISVSYDEISGTTESTVTGSDLTALGSDADSTITLTEYTKDSAAGTAKKHRGLVVDATAEHNISGVAITAGAAVTSTVSVGVAGTVTVNKIKGETNATVKNTAINSGATDLTSADVHVGASDRSTAASYVGALAGAISGEGGAALGGASDTETISRNVTASIDNSNKTINAADAAVKALNKADVTTQAYGVSIAGGATGAGSLAGTVSTALLDGTTRATVMGVQGSVGSLGVAAEHKSAINLVSAAGAAAIAVASGAVGAGIGIVNDKSNTVAAVEDSTIVASDTQSASTERGAISVNAANDTSVTTHVVGLGGGVVAAGINVGVNNLNNTVSALVKSSTLTADRDLAVKANNTITTSFTQASVAGGMGALGIGVGVNTIDTGVVTQVQDSTIEAGSVTTTADESLTLNNNIVGAAVGGYGLAANVAITSIGSVLAEQYGDSSRSSSATFSPESILNTANSYRANRDSATSDSSSATGKLFASNALKDGDGKALSTSSTATASKGTSSGAGVQVKVTGSSVNAKRTLDTDGKVVADGSVKVAADRAVNATLTSAAATLGSVGALSASVAVLDVARNSAVDISDSTIIGKDVSVTSTQRGKSAVDAYQAAVSGTGAIGAAYAQTSLSGKNAITIGDSLLQASGVVTTDNVSDAKFGTGETAGTLTVRASDTSAGEVAVHGLAASGFAGGVLITNAKNTSDTSINVKDSALLAASSAYAYNYTLDDAGSIKDVQKSLVGYTNVGKVAVESVKANSLKATTVGGAVGIAAAQGVIALASDSGSSTVNVSGARTLVQASDDEYDSDTVLTLLGDSVSVSAENSPAVTAEAESAAGSLLAGAGASIATATATGSSTLTIGSGTALEGNNLEFSASANSSTAAPTVNAKVTGNSISGVFGAQANAATATANMTVTTDVANALYNVKELLTITGTNSTTAVAKAGGVQIGGVFGTGENLATTNTTLTTNVRAAGSEAGSTLGDVVVSALTLADITNDATGYGGGIVAVSSTEEGNPVAAKSENTLTTNTTTTITGGWSGASALTATAVNSDDLDLTADSVSATVIGASGTVLTNKVTHNANVNVAGTVATTGAQVYHASNILDHKGTLTGSGYGAGSLNAADMKTDLTFNAGVNFAQAQATAAGRGGIEALADTSGTLDYQNTLKSAGVIPVALASSNNTINYNNSVAVTGSTLTTTKEDQDITLAATDDTKVSLGTTADTQGGVIGAASAENIASFNRSNKVNLAAGSTIEAANDANIYAGAAVDGISSALDYTATADAYNKTLLPLCTKPTVNNNMHQANQVDIAGDLKSVRHINLKAGKGSTLVTESAREYNFYTGDGGSGTVASTALGETPGAETYANFVNISGNATAGIHNALDVTISGTVDIKEAVTDASGNVTSEGKISYDNIKVVVNDGDEWFDNTTIAPGEVTLTNSLMERYNKLNSVIGQYDTGSNEYKIIKAEMTRLAEQMVSAGLAKKVGEQYYLYDSITLPAIAVPDTVISGGNITVTADAVTGSGQLTAQSAKSLNITNESNLYLKVNDLAVKSKGGSITYNAQEVKSAADIAGFSGTATGATSTATPDINVVSTSATRNVYSGADIGIFGTVHNSAGDINITNKNYNITVDGSARVNGRNVNLKAESGSISQNSDGILTVGNDPIMKYQFSDTIAAKIQKYISRNNINTSFASYADYVAWIKKNISLTPDELAEINKTVDGSAGSIQAEGNVYLSGLNVNIDGLVQSGYQSYTVKLDASMKAKIAELDTAYAQNKVALTDKAVLADASGTYCLNPDGGAVYNSETGQYDYNVRVYYNPDTQNLLTEDITPNGGKIYITGAVSSTGGGRLRAMNGTPDISIDTSVADRDLHVGTITNANIEGLISITDTQKNTLTEYRTDGTKTTVNQAILDSKKTGGTSGDSTIDGTTGITYSPDSSMIIQWTGGTSGDETTVKKEYTKKTILWGGIKWGKTEDFIKNVVKTDGTTTVSVTTTDAEKTLGTGVVIGSGTASSDYSVTTNKWNTSATRYSDVVPSKIKYISKIIGYGKITYTWTETTGSSTSSTYTIKANSGIDVGFMTGTSGNISVISNKDLYLDGNISNATTTAGAPIGTITLQSKNGAVLSGGDATVRADTLNISAATDIDVNHSAITDTASVNTSITGADGGDTTIKSTSGNLLFASSVGSAKGNLTISASGNIETTGGATLTGQRIDLTSATGSITALVAPGTELTSSDTTSASINATAYGDITLENKNGDMRVGTIKSTTGDVTLTTSGNFVDAIGEGKLSDAESKVEKWQELGLTNANDTADSRTAAAAAAKSERTSALESQAKRLASTTGRTVEAYKSAATAYASDTTLAAAKDTYIAAVKAANGDTAAVEAAYKTFQEAQQAYFAGQGYTTAEQEWIASYAEVSTSTSYGWSKNDLLYAIQSSVLNSEPGEVMTVTTPNISARNITLNASGIGVDGAAEEIAYSDLTKLENLKVLAQSKAGDLTWDDESQVVTVRQQQPLSVDIREGGKLTLHDTAGGDTVSGNVYLAGVKNTTLDLTGGIRTASDVKLLADKGITMSSGTIVAKNLTLMGGSGDIGSAESSITTDISGNLEANSSGSIYIHQTALDGDADVLKIMAIAAGSLYLNADNGMVMTTEQGKTAGYINAGLINLTAGSGDIGTASDGIRIAENGAVVNASAKNGSIYLTGSGTAGTLTLDTIELAPSGTLGVTTQGALTVGDDEEDTIAASTITLDAGTALTINTSLDSSADLTLTAGSDLTVNNSLDSGANLALKADSDLKVNGSVTAAQKADITAGADMTLANSVKAAQLGTLAAGKDMTISGSLTSDTATAITAGNNLTINNELTMPSVSLSAGGIISAVTTSDLVVTDATAGSTLALNTSGNLQVTNATATGDLTLEAGGTLNATNVKTDGAATLTAGSTLNADTVTAGSAATIKGSDVTLDTVTAGGAALITATNDVKVTSVTAGGGLNIDAGGATQIGALSAKGDTVLTSGGDLTTETITADGSLTATAQGSITTSDLSAGKDLKLTAANGSITTGNVTSGQAATLTATNGAINTGAVTANGAITYEAKDSITTNGVIETTDGSITLGTNSADNGNISLGGDVKTANGNVNISVAQNGSLLGDGSITAFGIGGSSTSGNINVDANGAGDVKMGTMTATNDINLNVNNGSVALAKAAADRANIDLGKVGASLDIDDITELGRLNVTGTAINIDKIEQSYDADGTLVIRPKDEVMNKPITYLSFTNVAAPNGVRFERLWVDSAYIVFNTDNVTFDKLIVEDIAIIGNGSRTSAIWGKDPIRFDDADSAYYVPAGNRPTSDMASWTASGTSDRWMYLTFAGRDTQYSNGVLLSKLNGYRVVNQRYTAVEQLQEQLSVDRTYGYRRSFIPRAPHFMRYDLLDFSAIVAAPVDNGIVTVAEEENV